MALVFWYIAALGILIGVGIGQPGALVWVAPLVIGVSISFLVVPKLREKKHVQQEQLEKAKDELITMIDEACTNLISHAKEKDARDNISVILAREECRYKGIASHRGAK